MKIAITLSLLLAVAGPTLAQNRSAMQQCRALTDGAARLACYDALPLDAAPPTTTTAPAAPAAQFGLERQAAKTATTAADNSRIESHIEGAFNGWEPNARIKLANGQVWQVTDNSSANYRLQNPKVKVTRGLVGGFFLEIAGANHSPRVRRLE